MQIYSERKIILIKNYQRVKEVKKFNETIKDFKDSSEQNHHDLTLH